MKEPAEPTCPICEYSLVGLPRSGRCPECGCVYTPQTLALQTARPRGGWLVLLIVPVAAAVAAPGLLYLSPLGNFFALLALGCCWIVARRVAAWRHEVWTRAHLRGERSRPPQYYYRLIQQLIFVSAVLLTFLVWAMMP